MLTQQVLGQTSEQEGILVKRCFRQLFNSYHAVPPTDPRRRTVPLVRNLEPVINLDARTYMRRQNSASKLQLLNVTHSPSTPPKKLPAESRRGRLSSSASCLLSVSRAVYACA